MTLQTKVHHLRWYSRFFTTGHRWTSFYHAWARVVTGDTVIHVIDDIRQIRKDFSCKQSRLLEHMKCAPKRALLGIARAGAWARNQQEVKQNRKPSQIYYEWIV